MDSFDGIVDFELLANSVQRQIELKAGGDVGQKFVFQTRWSPTEYFALVWIEGKLGVKHSTPFPEIVYIAALDSHLLFAAMVKAVEAGLPPALLSEYSIPASAYGRTRRVTTVRAEIENGRFVFFSPEIGERFAWAK